MFSKAIALLDQYASRTGTQARDSFNPDLAAEVKERLRQLDFIVAKVRALEEADEVRHRQFVTNLWKHVTLPDAPGASPPTTASAEMASLIDEKQASMIAVTLEIRLLTEAFYYFAFRIRQILKHPSEPLPGLSSFECVEVRNIRNNLIEHPARLFHQSITCGQPTGPTLKTGAPSAQSERFKDAGLYVNAEEFERKFVRVVQSASQSRREE